MPDPTRMNSPARSLPWLLAIFPFALLLYVVLQYGVPVPYLDEWDLIPLLQKMYGGTLALGDIWQLHNEHRLFFPQIIMLGLARLTHWDLRYEMAASVVFAIGMFLLLAYQAHVTGRKLAIPALSWAIPLFSVIVFSISQYQNWLWGWQLEIFLSVLAVLGGIVLLSNPPFTWVRFFGAALSGVVASYSFGNGGVFWLTGWLVLWVMLEPGKNRRMRLVLWSTLAGLTMGFYFYQYKGVEEHPPLNLLFSEPVPYLGYVLKYLGNIGAQYSARNHSMVGTFSLIYGIAGLAILIWTVMVLRGSKPVDWRLLVPFFAMILYSLGSAMIIGVGRIGLGADQAGSSRYCTVTAPFWAALVTILCVLSTKPEIKIKPKSRLPGQARSPGKPPAYQEAARWFLGFVGLLLVSGSVMAVNAASILSRNLEIGRQRLLTIPLQLDASIDYRPLGALHPRPEVILERFPFLKERRLSIFRDETVPPPQSQP